MLTVFVALAASARDKPANWIEVHSPHFTVVSNSSEKQARHVAGQFERMRLVFHDLFPHANMDTATPIVVLALKEKKDFLELEPQAKGQIEVAGLFLRAPDKNYVLLRLDAQGDHPYATVYHEYTHLHLSRLEDWLPLWINEGLAEYYQTMEIRDDRVLRGEPSVENVFFLRQNDLLPLETLFTVDSNSPYYHEEHKGSIFYAECWALTHYLQVKDGQEGTHRLFDYLELVSQKVDPVTAGTRAFGDLKQLQAKLAQYISQGRFVYLARPLSTEVDDATFSIRTLTLSQADSLRADFLAYNQREDDARRLLDRVLQDDPNNVSAHETMGYLEFRHGHNDEARKWYEQAIKLGSPSFLAYYYFAAISMRGEHLNSDLQAQIETDLRMAIKLNSSFAPAYDDLAVFLRMQGQKLGEAHMLALSAVTLDPKNLRYWLDTADVLSQSGRTKDALTVLQNAMPLAKTPEEVATIQSLLEAARQHQREQEQAGQTPR